MDNNDSIQNRIEELIAELSDCREDERNTQNQILEMISVTSTILGILFSASYLNPESRNISILIFSGVNVENPSFIDKICNIINESITYSRILFWISTVIFCMAFTYIIVLGIDNILRYHYVQDIEDRLHQLIPKTPDNEGRGYFLHWNAYRAPIVTKNLRHITSTHTVLNYACYVMATVCAILFSMGIVISLFLEINPKKWFDYFIIGIVLFGMFLTFGLFMRLTANAKKVAQYAWDTAHENQKIRLNLEQGNLYGKAKSFKRVQKYLIYPKRQDKQKPVLIILGFVYACILKNSSVRLDDIFKVIFVWFIFDFLAYQARYQINDIRGLDEDKEAGCQNRLLSDDINNPEHIIKISLIVALGKIVASLILTVFFGGKLKRMLLTGLGTLFVSTILYEMARDKKNTWLIFIFVGVGYPLRFCMGFFTFMQVEEILIPEQMICFILALWTYGSFSAILAWVNEVTNRIQKTKKNANDAIAYKKKHFESIQNIIIDRYILAQKCPINGKIIPMREKSKLKDPWNIMLLLSLSFLFFVALIGKVSKILLFFEFIICVVFILSIYFKHRKKLILFGISWCVIGGKIITGILLHVMSSWYMLLSVTQILITVTYFVLCYQPQMKKFNFKEVFCRILYNIKIKVLGEYAVNILKNGKKKSNQ